MKNFVKIFTFVLLLSGTMSFCYAKDGDLKAENQKVPSSQNTGEANPLAQKSEVIASSGVMTINTKDAKQVETIRKMKMLFKEENQLKAEGKTEEALAKSKEIEQTKAELNKMVAANQTAPRIPKTKKAK